MNSIYRHPTRVNPTKMNPLYLVFCAMHQRCQEDYKYAHRYFQRGIAVAKCWAKGQWDTFADWALSHGYQEGLELDRRNNDKGYSPRNCRFVSHLENFRNRDIEHHKQATRAGILRRTPEQTARINANKSAGAFARWAKQKAA